MTDSSERILKDAIGRRQRTNVRAESRARTDRAAAAPIFTAATPHETYVGVQLLRGLAAMLVVIFHAGDLVRDHFPELGNAFLLQSGAGGVDIFFPISGFVMLISSRTLLKKAGGWKVFVERRLIRIVPLYWGVTTLKIATVLAFPMLALHSHLSSWHSIASYLFIFAENSEGIAVPVVPVGWTLNFEMFFYAVFAFVLFLRKPLLPTVTALLALAVILGFVLPVDAAPLTVLEPLILEFGAGLWIAHSVLTGRRLGAGVAAASFIVGLSALLGVSAFLPDLVIRWRLLLWGLPGALLVYAAASLEPWFARRNWDIGRLLGDASYSIYLSHGFVLPLLGVLAFKLGVHGIAGAVATFGLAITASAAVGIAVHLYIERPVTQTLMHWNRIRQSRADEVK